MVRTAHPTKLTQSRALTYVRVQVEMPVAFHRVDQAGEHRLQPLPTDPIRRLPGHDQRLSNRLGNKIQ